MNQVGDSTEFELDAPFFFGMAEVAKAKQLIDGGEVYQLRTAQQFDINRNWRTNEMANSIVVPESLRNDYGQRIGITHGLYNLTWPTADDEMSPAIMRSTLRNALQSRGKYVWLFIESFETWLTPGGFPNDWRENIAGGFDDAQIQLGDVNGDGAINLLDVPAMIEAISNAEYSFAADVNCDGIVNLLDVAPFIAILQN